MTTTREAVTALVQSFFGALTAQDAEALGSLFTDDAEFVNIFAGRMHGRADIEAQHARHFGMGLQGVRLTGVVTHVKELGPDAAVLHAEWTREVTATSGAATMPPGKGVFTFVATRSGDRWSFAAAQNTQQSAPPGR